MHIKTLEGGPNLHQPIVWVTCQPKAGYRQTVYMEGGKQKLYEVLVQPYSPLKAQIEHQTYLPIKGYKPFRRKPEISS
jgi:hypothetical protein